MAFNSTESLRCDSALMHSTACFASSACFASTACFANDSGQALMAQCAVLSNRQALEHAHHVDTLALTQYVLACIVPAEGELLL